MSLLSYGSKVLPMSQTLNSQGLCGVLGDSRHIYLTIVYSLVTARRLTICLAARQQKQEGKHIVCKVHWDNLNFKGLLK